MTVSVAWPLYTWIFQLCNNHNSAFSGSINGKHCSTLEDPGIDQNPQSLLMSVSDPPSLRGDLVGVTSSEHAAEGPKVTLRPTKSTFEVHHGSSLSQQGCCDAPRQVTFSVTSTCAFWVQKGEWP